MIRTATVHWKDGSTEDSFYSNKDLIDGEESLDDGWIADIGQCIYIHHNEGIEIIPLLSIHHITIEEG